MVMELVTIEEYAAKLYIMDTSELEDDVVFNMNYKRLSKARRAKIDSYYFEKDKRLSLGAGMLLDIGLSDYGLKESEVSISYGTNGKPYLPMEPHIHFNISHSGKIAVAVFADVETGCDVELVQKADLSLAERFFCAWEYGYIVQQDGEEQRGEAFYRLWTLKESFIKATGIGLSLPLDKFEINVWEGEEITVCQYVDNSVYHFKEYKPEGYHIAVCFRN